MQTGRCWSSAQPALHLQHAAQASYPVQASLSASNYYGGMYPRDEYGGFVTKGSALETRMMAARGSAYQSGRRSKPPDLPSKLLDARIVYIGMPVRPCLLPEACVACTTG